MLVLKPTISTIRSGGRAHAITSFYKKKSNILESVASLWLAKKNHTQTTFVLLLVFVVFGRFTHCVFKEQAR
jgi:hypothetical protein